MATLKFVDGRYEPYTLADCLRYMRDYPSKHFVPKPTLVSNGWRLRFIRP